MAEMSASLAFRLSASLPRTQPAPSAWGRKWRISSSVKPASWADVMTPSMCAVPEAYTR
jgi:hypothetical protein